MSAKIQFRQATGHLLKWLVMIGLVLPAVQRAGAAVSFNVTPGAVSNTFGGTVSLQIAGLNTGDTVVVQKYLDANTNGAIDAADSLVQQFQVTDGKITVIGGITNENIPGDLNPTNGSIFTKLLFKNGDFSQQIIGKYLYKISSPSNSFTPITNSFAVTNFPYAQTINGTVVSGSNVPNAVILVFPPKRAGNHGPGTPVAGVVANNNGGYSVQVPAGTYPMLAFKSNYVANYSLSPVVTVGGGGTVTTNIPLTNATFSVSGKYVDSTNASLGIPGVFLPLSENGVFGIGFTDTNGNFTVPVGSGQNTGGDGGGLNVHGYVGSENELLSADTTGGNVSGVTVSLPRATALFYGTILDNLGNPLAGIGVGAQNDQFQYESDVVTDASGLYVAGIVGGLVSAPWQVNLNNSEAPTNYIFSQPPLDQNGTGTNVSVGQAVQVNFTALPVTGSISGTVKDNNNNPLVGIQVFAGGTINGTNYFGQGITDANGQYAIFVANGVWGVNLNCCNSCGNGLNSSLYQCPNTQNINIANNNGNVNFVVATVGLHVLSGSVLDGNSNPITNVTVTASGDGTNYTTTTGGNGAYQFVLADGSWLIAVSCSELQVLGYSCPGSLGVPISGSDSSGNDIIVPPPALLISSPLPPGTVGASYFEQLQVSGGTPPYDWTPVGGNFPGGLMLSTNGVISGVPTNSGNYVFTVEVTDNIGDYSDEEFSLLINTAPLPDYDFYYVTKARAFSQLSGNTVVPYPGAPDRAILGIYQYAIGSVSNGVVDLPTGLTAIFPAGNTAQELDIMTSFQNQAALDSAYPNGQYAFVINGQHSGFQLLSVTLPGSTNYPPTPQISNFGAAQTVNVSNAFTVQWLPDLTGPNDFIWLYVTPTNSPTMVYSTPYPPGLPGALNGNSTAATIPAGTLQPGITYQGTLLFVRTVGTNGLGFANLDSGTFFNLVTTGAAANPAPPTLSATTFSAANGFSLTLTGTASKNYAIEVSTNLVNWTTLTVLSNIPAGPVGFTDAGAKTLSRRYYRAQAQ